MKKLYLFAFLILPLVAISCTQERVNPDQGLVTAVTEMVFPRWGETQTLEIEVLNLDDWSAYSNMSWIELGEPDLQNGTVQVTVRPTEEINDLHGEIIIYSELSEVAKVQVTQRANGILFDRPTALLMNLKGPVKSLDLYFNPIYMWETNTSQIEAIEFDERGRLSSMTYFEVIPPYTGVNDATFTFDDQNRPLTMEVKSRNMTGIGNVPYEFAFTFNYDDSEKYIEVHDLFFGILQMEFEIYTDARIWMPRMLKGLRSIDIESNGFQYKSMMFDFRPAADGTVVCVLAVTDKDDRPLEQELYTYHFAGNFTVSCKYMNYYMYSDEMYPHSLDFVIDPETGNILSEVLSISVPQDNSTFTVLERRNHNNLSNSCHYFYDMVYCGYDMNIEYDENWNAVHINERGNMLKADYEYEYDDWGNIIYTTMKIQQPGGSGDFLTQERPFFVTYHE